MKKNNSYCKRFGQSIRYADINSCGTYAWFPHISLTRHGTPPTEPWLYSKEFTDYFRKCADMKYELTPYIYAQAKQCTGKGLPMFRALFIEFPDDPGAWLVENEYLFGSNILVAPLFSNNMTRDMYLLRGNLIDYQTDKTYSKGWNKITEGDLEAIILVNEGSIVPHAKLAQSTKGIGFHHIELKIYGNADKADGLVCLPENNKLVKVDAIKADNRYVVKDGNVNGVTYKITTIK